MILAITHTFYISKQTIIRKDYFRKGEITMIKKRWIILIVLVLALTLSACTRNSTKNNSNDQSKGDSANTHTNEDTNKDTNIDTNKDANVDTNIDTNKGTNIDTNMDTNKDTNKDGNKNSDGTTTNVAYKDIKLTPGEAFNVYVKKYPKVKVNKLALDLDLGSYVYEMEGYENTNKYELKIEPVEGKILREEQKKRDDNDTEGEITIENVNKIQELIDKALQDAGNSYKVNEWELKSEKGKSIFDIEVVDVNDNDIEYKYNINTMELIEKD